MKLRQFLLGKTDATTFGPAPDFENVVKVIISTFAVFVGFTINSYLNKPEVEDFRNWRFWAFIALASLLLRYIVGSSVHLNHVYVKKITVEKVERPRSRSAFLLFKDICFLVVFGMIAVHTAKATTFNEFVTGTLWFVGAGFVWSILDLALRRQWSKNDTNEAPGHFVRLWIALDVALFVIVIIINQAMGHELTRAMVIAVVYVVFLFLDFLAIVRASQFG